MLSNHSHIPCNLRGFLGREKERKRGREREREREVFGDNRNLYIIIIAPIH